MEIEIKNIRASIRRKIREDKKNIFHVESLSNLSSEFIYSIQPIAIPDKGYWKDCVYYVMDTILKKSTDEDFKPGSKFVALNAVILKKVLGNDTHTILQTLLDNRVLLTDGKYSTGIISFGYKIHPKYYLKGVHVYKTLTNQKVIRRFVKFREEFYKNQTVLLYQNAHLVKWLLDGKLMFLNGFAKEYEAILEQGIALFFKTHYEKLSVMTISNMMAKANFWSYRGSEDEIVNICMLPKISKKGLRLYSFVTSMHSPLRNLLLYDSLPLVYIDISNSQPFHFLVILQSSFWKPSRDKGTLCLQNLNEDLYQQIMSKNKEEMETTIMFLENHENKHPDGFKGSKDVVFRKSNQYRSFSSLVMNGKLYKFIADNFTGKFSKNGVDPFGDKKCSKETLISMLYAQNTKEYAKNKKYFKHFATIFPFEAKIIDLLKSRDYRDFSIILQHIESHIMLQRVCKDIYDNNPKMPIFTIHDGILAPNYHENIVREALERIYQEIVGVEPSYKIDQLRPSNLDFVKFKESLIKKARKMAETNKLQWQEPSQDFLLRLYPSYADFYNRIKDIPKVWFNEIGCV